MGALSGLKILDFSYLLPGPLATLTLADLGADVLKIESPTRLDIVRMIPPFVDEENAISSVHAYLNRNKRTLALNLKHPYAKTIIANLIRDLGYDIIVEQFRPGVMARLGLSYADLCGTHPGLIYCSLTGYGQTGPLQKHAGHDLNYMSLSGVASYCVPGAGPPRSLGVPIADISGSLHAAIGILAAVIQRERTGRGEHIDIAMTDCMFPYHALLGSRTLAGAHDPAEEIATIDNASLYGFYETADGKYLAFGGMEAPFIAAFLTALGLGDLLVDGLLPFFRLPEAKSRVQEVVRSRPLVYWAAYFENRDACCEPVLTFSEMVLSEHVKARELVVEVPGPKGVALKQIACPIKLSHSTPEYRVAGSVPGQDSWDILLSMGFSRQHIEQMQAQEIVFCRSL